jgi:hypothetical protein
LFFEANGNDVRITDAWDEKGIKNVDNGKGSYQVNMDGVLWQGKLLDGKPNGTWGAVRTNDISGDEIMTEKYKNGVFQKGKSSLGE